MARRGRNDFHNGRGYGADKSPGSGLLNWLRRQFEKMLRAGGEPGSEIILFTHALDDQFRNLRKDPRQRQAAHHGTPFEGDPR